MIYISLLIEIVKFIKCNILHYNAPYIYSIYNQMLIFFSEIFRIAGTFLYFEVTCRRRLWSDFKIGGSLQSVLTPEWKQEDLMGSKDRKVHVQQSHIPLSRQSWETRNVTLSISSFPLCKSPSITSLSPADLRGPLTGPCYPGTGEMQIDFISGMAFLKPPHATQSVISGKDMKIRGKCQTVDWLYNMKSVVYSDHQIMKQDTI